MKHIHATAIMMTASLLAAGTLLASCGSSSTTVTNRLVTEQQQETDLKRALDAGAITQDEYQEAIDKLHGQY